MFLQLEDGKKIEYSSKKQIQNIIYTITNSFVVLEDDKGNYIQAGGGKEGFTVEVRIYSNNDFSHWKAENNQTDSYTKRIICISGTNVQIQDNQIIDCEKVIALFDSFSNGNYLSKIVNWRDMTFMFKDT